jgi:tetratricopeptide (TPR) repeat protein
MNCLFFSALCVFLIVCEPVKAQEILCGNHSCLRELSDSTPGRQFLYTLRREARVEKAPAEFLIAYADSLQQMHRLKVAIDVLELTVNQFDSTYTTVCKLAEAYEADKRLEESLFMFKKAQLLSNDPTEIYIILNKNIDLQSKLHKRN